VDPVPVHRLPDPVGDHHVVRSLCNEDMDARDNGRLGELPYVELVDRDYTVDFLDRLADVLEGDMRRHTLQQDVRGGLDWEMSAEEQSLRGLD
jgi:hypothetical protein